MSGMQLSAGDRITSKCTKCKDITNHTIVAMVEDTIAKVECNTCGGVHNYRNATAKKSVPKRRVSATKPAKTNKTETEWGKLLEGLDPATAAHYSMQMVIESGELIQHPSFGLGRVINVTKPNKMEVYFSSGIKLLRCTLV